MLDPPYPADTKANGWKPEMDVCRIDTSETWVLATEDERPWLLRIWFESWRSVPVGSMPGELILFSRRIGCKIEYLETHEKILLRNWKKHLDGRLYHPYITEQVIGMLEKRKGSKYRQENFRNQAKIIKERDGWACVYCGSDRNLTVDHVVPVKQGGDNRPDNLVCACKSCNFSKRHRTPAEAGLTFVDKNKQEIAEKAIYRILGNNPTGKNDNALFVVTNAQEQEQEQEQDIKSKDTARASSTKPNFNTWPQSPNPEQWAEILKFRKAKKAKNTQRAIDLLGNQIKIAISNGHSFTECMDTWEQRQWCGFDASWMDNQKNKNNGAGQNNGNGNLALPNVRDVDAVAKAAAVLDVRCAPGEGSDVVYRRIVEEIARRKRLKIN